MSASVHFLILAAVLTTYNVSCKNVLFAVDLVSPSHKIWNFALVEGLLQKGHNVTMLAPDNLMHLGKEYENYHPIYLEGLVKKVMEDGFNPNDMKSETLVQSIFHFYDYIIDSCENALTTKGMQTLLDYPENFEFDVIIYDATASSCLLPLMKRFNNPATIAVTAFLLPHYLSHQFGNGVYPAYIPSYLGYPDPDMNFQQRLVQYLLVNTDLLLRHFYVKSKIEGMMRKRFGDWVDIIQLEQQVSLLLCNLEPTLHYPQPLIPNIIPVGGLHMKPARPLPEDLKKIADNAKQGIILFSLGTNVRSDKLGPKVIEALLQAFSKIKHIVIWKFESELKEYIVPSNVIIRKWLPQNDILGHPNTKLFITHAGGLSTIEAAYHGVPILGMPVFADQPLNMRMMEMKGIGKSIDFETLRSDTMLKALRELLDDVSYSRAAGEVSERMKDQPQHPLDRAVFWIEYAMRRNGTHFLDTKSRFLSSFVSNALDVEIFILFVLATTIFIVKKVIYFTIRSLQGNVKTKKE